MPKKLDYSEAWSDALAMLSVHREAVIAVAGFFLFAIGWLFAFLVPEPDLQGEQTLETIVAALLAHSTANWMYILPFTIIASYGSFVIYVLLSGQILSKVGDALTLALRRFLPYFVASLIVGWVNLLGLAALLIPGLYLIARFVVLPSVMAANPQLGIVAGIRESWATTAKAGWKTFALLAIVILLTWLISYVVNMLIGLACVMVAGPEGIPLVQTGVEALLSTISGIIFIALVTAIYRQLRPQAATR